MLIAVAVLDHDDWGGSADVIVLVDPRSKSLTWVPRDLWSPLLKERINCAIFMGGAKLLREALLQLGFSCDGVLCLLRGASETILRDISVTVPVKAMMAFWVASMPSRNIRHGRKFVAFVPPRETLRGERIHQWLGARYSVNGTCSDLHRIERQQILLRVMLDDGANFQVGLADPQRYETAGTDPLPTLRLVDRTWTMTTFLSFVAVVIDGKPVLQSTLG